MSEAILRADGLWLHYQGLPRAALAEVSMEIAAGRTLGIVGESGSGKSSLARCLLGLEKLSGGEVRYRGQDIGQFSAPQMKQYRRCVQMVFQDPYHSLNPRKTVGAAIEEVLRVHRIAERSTTGLLERVGLHAAMADRYPHELSGGQRQRVGIARALAVGPEIIIADEPVSALDVSVQAHILNLLDRLVKETGVTLVLIAHDLAVVRSMCDRIVVMREGRVVEEGNSDAVINSPQHEYTRLLLASAPGFD